MWKVMARVTFDRLRQNERDIMLCIIDFGYWRNIAIGEDCFQVMGKLYNNGCSVDFLKQ